VGAPERRSPMSRRNVAVVSHAQYVLTITCDVGYLYANFSLPRPLCSRVRPDVCDRQTSDKSIA